MKSLLFVVFLLSFCLVGAAQTDNTAFSKVQNVEKKAHGRCSVRQ